MAKTDCYTITTKKFVILSKDNRSFAKTQELYNEILKFYYNLYLDCLSDDKIGNQEALRELEKMTISGRDKQPVSHPLPWEKIPLYFRRAAINKAITAAKGYLSQKLSKQSLSACECQKNRIAHFREPVTFYKGMYRELSEKSISLKLWNGEVWKWETFCLIKNTLSEQETPMSPSLVLKGKNAELHVPVKTTVKDGRNARERILSSERICAAIFTNKDTAVVCCVLDSSGVLQDAFFVRGGAQYAHRCQQILKKLKKSQIASKDDPNPSANKKYWMKLKHLNEYYSHKFSRQIIDYCISRNAKILVLPKYERQYTKYVMLSAGNWSPIHLSTQIRVKLKYKAWQSGIVVLETGEYHTSSVCSLCGERIKKQGGTFVCINGHQGNVYLNMACNLGKKCLDSMEKQVT